MRSNFTSITATTRLKRNAFQTSFVKCGPRGPRTKLTYSYRNGIIQGIKFRKFRVCDNVFIQGLYPHNFSELREFPKMEGEMYEADDY